MPPLGANLFVLLLVAAAPDGGEQPARSAEIVQEKLTFGEVRRRLEELRDGQREVNLATLELRRAMAIQDPWRNAPSDVAKVKPLAKQHALRHAAKALIARLEAEGTAVTFVEVLQQLRQDMTEVAARLEKMDLGADTRTLQDEIVATLEEMLEAVTKTR
jgi:hypothetical protein